MKKKIFLWVILVLEALIFISLGIFDSYASLKTTIPYNGIYLVAQYAYKGVDSTMHLIKLDVLLTKMFSGTYYPNLFIFISLVIFNLVFVGIYYAIFGPLTIVFRNKKEKELRQIVSPYELSNSEYEKFNYKNYLGNAPIKRIISLLIPIIFILGFIAVRFDANICALTNSNINGKLNISNKFIEPVISNFISPKNATELFSSMLSNSKGTGYVDLTNKLLSVAPWVEYGFIVVASVLVLGIWYGIFSLINLAIRKPHAKKKASLARERYIRKMENIEYKLHSKYKEETNIKADDFMHVIEKEQNDAAMAIAKYKKDKETEEQISTKEAENNKIAYYEEIGEGVNDLGVSTDSSFDYKPLTEREVKYISDEEIDIILDEELVIEIVESDDEDPLEVGKNDIFYERYQPDDVEIQTIEEYSGEDYSNVSLIKEEEETITNENNSVENEVAPQETNEPTVEEKEVIVNNQVVEEPIQETNKENQNEEVIEEKPSEKTEEQVVEEIKSDEVVTEEIIEEEPAQEEVIEEEPIVAPLDETPLSEEKQDETPIEEEPITLQEEIVENEIVEEPKVDTPVQKIVFDEVSESEENASQSEEEPKEEIIEVSKEDIVEEPKKEEPQRKKTFEDYIKRKPKPVEPAQNTTEDSSNPFAKYKNRRNDPGYGAKKVPTFKELEAERKAKEPQVVYVTDDPFKEYRNKKNSSGYGAKKVPSFKEIEEQKKNEK